MSTETWRAAVGHEGRYDVSDLGRVRSWVTNRTRRLPYVFQQQSDAWGYQVVGLTVQGRVKSYRVHRLVMTTFTGPRPDGQMVRHLNGDPTDNRLTNLTYGTDSENQADSVRHGTHAAASRTRCPSNHPYDDSNTYITPTGKRDCRTCRREAARRYRANRKALAS